MKLPFQQGHRPALVLLTAEDRAAFREGLRRAGYLRHRGPRTERPGEVGAWLRELGRGRQVHVQLDRAGQVFAHTEPAGVGVEHAVSALLGRANFSAGSRVLRADLVRVARNARGRR